ncbi:MAG: sulfatase-like hydrolase/transferase, partial [Chloroflexi bacterium]|nr:sulfatase-like hydrolase/transferase [Chloroflexota bacterium]
MADQLRADCLGCYGDAIVRSRAIDDLAARGTVFQMAFAQHPQCVPSRSSVMTGRYPHVNGSTSNHAPMADNEQTLPEYLQGHGYFTAAFGKTHLFSVKETSSYQFSMLSGGQTSNRTSPELLRPDYTNWLKANGYWDAVLQQYSSRALPEYHETFQAVVSPVPSEAYIDCWVGDQSTAFLLNQAQAKQPFFMFVGFPNPHNPFEPPEPYASLYRPADMPIPLSFHSDLSAKPPQHLAYKRRGRANLGHNYEHLTAEKLRRVIAHYYASVTLVDDQVAKIVNALEASGLIDNTIIIFLSDHGELLGHHGMLLKSTDAFPMLYDKSLHVPLIIAGPEVIPGQSIDTSVELVDLFPTLVDLIGLPIPPEVQGLSLLPLMQGDAPPSRQHIFAESGAVKMLRGERYKLIYYPGQPYGELYDLEADPLEMTNLHADQDYVELRTELTQALLDRLILMEGPRHGAANSGPAYWRIHYRL